MEAASSLQAAPSCLLEERRGENGEEDEEGSSRLMLETRAVACELRDQMVDSTCVCVCVCVCAQRRGLRLLCQDAHTGISALPVGGRVACRPLSVC